MEKINGIKFYPIENYENLYSVSRCGNIYSHIKNKIMKMGNNGKNYRNVILFKNGKRKMHYVHRLVAKTFLQKDLNKNYVNHKDFNKQNNRVENLEWVTAKENTAHAFEAGVMKNIKGIPLEGSPVSKLKNKDVLNILKMLSANIMATDIAKLYNVHSSTIYNIKHNKTWKTING